MTMKHKEVVELAGTIAAVVVLLGWAAFWLGVAYVAWHFISKVW